MCNKCDQPMTKLNFVNHLKTCFQKFGDFQCVFCVFGTSSFTSIDNHLSTHHPDKISYFAERVVNVRKILKINIYTLFLSLSLSLQQHGKDPKCIDALTIKELSKKITGNVKKIFQNCSFYDPKFRNVSNLGRISEELNFQPKPGENNVFVRLVKNRPKENTESSSSSKPTLQIGQVMSLQD